MMTTTPAMRVSTGVSPAERRRRRKGGGTVGGEKRPPVGKAKALASKTERGVGGFVQDVGADADDPGQGRIAAAEGV
jgi:hypothetical protein